MSNIDPDNRPIRYNRTGGFFGLWWILLIIIIAIIAGWGWGGWTGWSWNGLHRQQPAAPQSSTTLPNNHPATPPANGNATNPPAK